jgi:hypothetical protein
MQQEQSHSFAADLQCCTPDLCKINAGHLRSCLLQLLLLFAHEGSSQQCRHKAQQYPGCLMACGPWHELTQCHGECLLHLWNTAAAAAAAEEGCCQCRHSV